MSFLWSKHENQQQAARTAVCKPQFRGQIGGCSWCPALGHRLLPQEGPGALLPLRFTVPGGSPLCSPKLHTTPGCEAPALLSLHRGPVCWVGAAAPSAGPDLAGSQGTEVPSYTGPRTFPETKIAPNKVIMPLTLSLTTEA